MSGRSDVLELAKVTFSQAARVRTSWVCDTESVTHVSLHKIYFDSIETLRRFGSNATRISTFRGARRWWSISRCHGNPWSRRWGQSSDVRQPKRVMNSAAFSLRQLAYAMPKRTGRIMQMRRATTMDEPPLFLVMTLMRRGWSGGRRQSRSGRDFFLPWKPVTRAVMDVNDVPLNALCNEHRSFIIKTD